jgi:ribose transport system permease protein
MNDLTGRDGAVAQNPPEASVDATAPSKGHGVRRSLTYLADRRPLLLIVLILLLSGYMAWAHGKSFATTSNAEAVLLNASQSAILVVGMMLLMIGGSFDLSIGSVLAFSGVCSALLVTQLSMNPILAIACGILIGGACGVANGLIVTKLRINALIATLAMAGILRGITQQIGGTNIPFVSEEFARFGQAEWLGLQSPFWVSVLVVSVGAVLVAKTRYFRQYYFVGSNRRAALLSGMRTDRLMLVAFILMGLIAGLAGVLGAARLNSASATAGIGVELSIITAAVLGGATLRGGEGTIVGGVLGVLFIALIQNSLVILSVNVLWQQIIVGLVLLLTVSFDRLREGNG